MLANQYFISGRYSEALSEYSKLTSTTENDVVVMEKMIMSAALTENFECALNLLLTLINEKVETLSTNTINNSVCPCTEIVNKLENDRKVNKTSSMETEMKIAILSFFTDKDKSMKYFQKLKKSCYADMIKPVLTSLKNTIN